MSRIRYFALPALLSLSACGGDSGWQDPGFLHADDIRDRMQTLSSDAFLGRGPGQPGGDLAVAYITEQFQAMGLEPVNGSYVQTVPMVETTTDPESVSLRFSAGGAVVEPTYLDEFVLNSGDPEAAESGGSAELVFVGYGIDAPENEWNDFAGTDVAGKVLLILVNDPPAPADEPDLFGGPAMTYYGRWTYKYEEAARQGALGAIIVHETEPAGYPWSVVRGGWSGPQFDLPPDPSAATVGVLGWVSHEIASQALALAGLDFAELKAAAAQRGFSAVPTGITVDAALTSGIRRVETQNVVGLLPGASRPDEYITMTSHYDHFGMGEVIDGDSIYNGAYDNASGTALLMEIAQSFTELPERPVRSILFIAIAAEEQGLLGAHWYAQSPLFPLNRTVAEINIDGANLWGETDDVIAQGSERSGLGAFVQRRADQMGLTIMPDAEPEKGFFFRSDHFPFALAGVPSLYIEHGRDFRGRPKGWGDETMEVYTAVRYHAPSDEFSDEFVFDGAVQQGTLVLLTALDVANDDSWPDWHEGQEFKAARDRMMTGN
ncbi:MAG: M28 family peptidase [Gemmatimonadota bacterium]|nr:M28 family peptidase [Gemmatimonadota bacterium]